METALVPPFLVNRLNYTAMIPYEFVSTKMLLWNKGVSTVESKE